jgi:hypothetical protein
MRSRTKGTRPSSSNHRHRHRRRLIRRASRGESTSCPCSTMTLLRRRSRRSPNRHHPRRIPSSTTCRAATAIPMGHRSPPLCTMGRHPLNTEGHHCLAARLRGRRPWARISTRHSSNSCANSSSRLRCSNPRSVPRSGRRARPATCARRCRPGRPAVPRQRRRRTRSTASSRRCPLHPRAAAWNTTHAGRGSNPLHRRTRQPSTGPVRSSSHRSWRSSSPTRDPSARQVRRARRWLPLARPVRHGLPPRGMRREEDTRGMTATAIR